MAPFIQILPTHKAHAATFADALSQMGFSRARVSSSRRGKPAAVVVIQCETCRCNSGLNLGLHINKPRAPLVFVRFTHADPGCNVVPAGVVAHPWLAPDVAKQLAAALTAGPSQ